MSATHNTKNYAAHGGQEWVIGGKLTFLEGAEVDGFPGAENQAAEAPGSDTVAKVRTSVNNLLTKLKNAGIMIPDAWKVTFRLAPSLTDVVAAANNAKATITVADNVITVNVDVNDLEESTSSAPGQGTHKWLGLGIGTGLSSVTLVKYNGGQLTSADAEEAVSVGLDQPGEFVLYIKTEAVAESGKSFTLNADGYAPITIDVQVAAPIEQSEQ